MNNIVLIGMPGVGKSTIGVVLAKSIGYKFLDTDIVIQEKEGRLLQEIIYDAGDEGFRQIENNINTSIDASMTVIATGGSAVYGADAMEHFKKTGTVIYLKHSFKEIAKRLGDINKRGVTIKKGQTLENLYDERTPLYEKYADLTVDCRGKNIRDIVEEIKLRLMI